jgi:hypothetical protein
MTIPSPNKAVEYPFYIIGYFIIIFAIAFLVSSWSTLTSLSPDGKYIQFYPCLETDIDYGREYCVLYDKVHPKSEIPVGSWLVERAKMDAIFVGIFVIPFGLYGWKKKYDEEKD